MVLRLKRHTMQQQQQQQKQQLLMPRPQPWTLTAWRNQELSSSLRQAVRSPQQRQRHQQKMQLSLRGTQALLQLPAGGEGRRGVRPKHLHGQHALLCMSHETHPLGALPCVHSKMTDAGGARALRKTPSRTRGQMKKPKGVRNTCHLRCHCFTSCAGYQELMRGQASRACAVHMSADSLQEQPDTDPEEDAATEHEGAKLQTRRSTRAVKKVKTFAEEFISSETPTASPGNGDSPPPHHV